MTIQRAIKNWKLASFYPYTPLLKNSMEIGATLSNFTPWIEASVPGSVQLDLYKERLIADPYRDCNSILCEWVENKWWIYRTTFSQEIRAGKRYFLRFEGLDYTARIFLNDEQVAIHENIAEALEIDVTSRIKPDNKLVVMFEHAPDVTGQVGYTSRTNTQKSRFNYKWDFSARLVNIGIFKPVYLLEKDRTSIEEFYIEPVLIDDHTGEVAISLSLDQGVDKDLSVSVLLDQEQIHSQQLSSLRTEIKGIRVDDISPWETHDRGYPKTYRLRIELYRADELIDSVEHRIGFKKLTFAQNENAVDALPYSFVLNGRKMYVKGVNMVPIDALFGNITAEKYDRLTDLMVDNNINLVRVWGGGIIESDTFYDLCSRKGILVWQDFLQSSSGIDNVPNESEDYLEKLRDTSIAAIKSTRNHVSLGVWCGGNELMGLDYVPSTYDNRNIGMLLELVKEYDPQRFMYPTTASGPIQFGDIHNKGKNHDIHGTWRYGGVKDHYTYFNEIDSLFHGEFGVEGMASLASLKKFLSAEHLDGSFTTENNYVWRHHGAEWWDTTERDTGIFGQLEDLETRITLSQFVQYEGLRYALEANRRRAFENSGSIIWQINEPFPNVSCTSLVDYYLKPKPALRAAKQAYGAINPNLKYHALVYHEQETIESELWITTDQALDQGTCTLKIQVDGRLADEHLFRFDRLDPGSTKLSDISFRIPARSSSVLAVMEVELKDRVITN
ncbi:MAG: glycoside hydrolase family 2 protein, partial [Acholeplasmataceae bacterium]